MSLLFGGNLGYATMQKIRRMRRALDLVIGKPGDYDNWRRAEHVSGPSKTVPVSVIKALSQLRPAVSCGAIALDWLLIIAAVLFCELYWSVPLYLLAVALIAARMSALGGLMHDASHYLVVRNKFLNDLISDLFCAWPIGTTTDFYRSARHFAHHKNIGLRDDPHIWQTYKKNEIWNFPQSKPALVRYLLIVMLNGPLSTVSGIFNSLVYTRSGRRIWARLAYYLVVVALVTYLGALELFGKYWLIPLAVWLPVLLEFRLMAELFGVTAHPDQTGAGTRTTLTNQLEKLFLVSHNLNYHAAHHLYPGIPFYNLPKLHEVLKECENKGEIMHVTRGYWRVFGELTRTASFP